MLFKVEYIDTNMIYLNEVLKHFIYNAVSLRSYRKLSLFPVEFLGVHDAKNNSIDSRFKAVFNELKMLDASQKKRLKRMYLNHQRVARLCQGSVGIVDFSGFPDGFKEALKKLGEYLYSSALNNSRIRELAIIKYGDNNSTLHELWKSFRDRNGVVCCFCGIQEYEEQPSETDKFRWRPAFDHYLPKEKYPLAAVNFKNLIPCCYQCNSKSKGAEDPCTCKEHGRKKALFPYNNQEVLGLKFEFIKENVAAKSPWVVSLKDEADEKHTTWDRVYDIKVRVKSRLNANYVNWIKVDCSECLTANVKDAKRTLFHKAAQYMAEAPQKREYVHKAIMMASLASANDDLLECVLNTISPDPRPSDLEEGMKMLRGLGFNF